MDWLTSLSLALALYVLMIVLSCSHVLLYKRDSRAAFGWLGLILVFPLAGVILYLLFGINRVRRKARREPRRLTPEGGRPRPGLLPEGGTRLTNVGYAVTGVGMSPGNRVECYHNGEQAFPAMLQAIAEARTEVLLSSYIFDNDATGLQFVAALSDAKNRGVRVAILLDDVGIRYSLPTVIGPLRRAGLEYRRFMPLRIIPPSLSLNLRTHRKILVSDRTRAFAGGMNIGDRQLLEGSSPHRASDLHFGFTGPIVADLVELFAEDWHYSGGADLQDTPAGWSATGNSRARLISDGPDETLDSLLYVIMGAIAAARKRVWIMTPYFLPDRMLTGCLCAAGLSGVEVKVMIPANNNWPVVQWALQHTMRELLDAGIEILQRPPPFAHSKCLLVDDDYLLIGSSNLDPRSLRLNFELGVELIDTELNAALASHFERWVAQCRPWSIQRLHARSYLVRMRDAAAALFSPYL